jgi:hypothetical protein
MTTVHIKDAIRLILCRLLQKSYAEIFVKIENLDAITLPDLFCPSGISFSAAFAITFYNLGYF